MSHPIVRGTWITRALFLAALVAVGSHALALGAAASEPGSGRNVCTEAGLPGPLWGLCNSYCEALDCDSGDAGGSDTACAVLERNFMRASGGEPPPCQVSAPDCPCFTVGEVTALALTLGDTSTYELLRCIDRRAGKPITALAAQRIDGAACAPESNDCSALAVEFTEDNACELNTPSESRQIQQITDGQREACRSAVIEGAGAAGLACN